jgi:hypothetical protein
MRSDRRTDFLFTGLAILPLALMLAGSLTLAMLAFLLLMFCACGCSVFNGECDGGQIPPPADRHGPS